MGWEAGDLHSGPKSDADFPSGHKQGVPVKLGMAESMDLGAGFLGF